MNIKLSAKEPEFGDFLNSMLKTAEERATVLFETTGEEVVGHLKSYTSARRPPIRPGGPSRPAHPGGWADVSKELMEGYGYRVTVRRGGAQLEIFNTAGHAVHLEARDGYFVVTGVMDEGGPVWQALRRRLREVAPEWGMRAL